MSWEEEHLRALMKRDGKIVGKLDDIRLGGEALPKGERGTPWDDEGISRSVYYDRLKKRRKRNEPYPDSLQSRKPWEKLGINRDTYFRRKKSD